MLKIGRAERTRAAILNAALELIWSRPFRDMTVGSLMDKTDVGRSAFYQYFQDLHEAMENVLNLLKDEVYSVTQPWFTGVGDPVVLLNESLAGLVGFGYRRGPIMRAIDHAAATDKQLEKDWRQFINQFDDTVASRIEVDQKQGLIQDLDARPIAIALNRLDVYMLIEAFGERPRKQPEPVQEALARIWISTLYGAEWLNEGSSDLVRK